jgi:hypothetical protein
MIHQWLQLQHHRHSGRVLPHHRTSYAGLTTLMLALGLILSAVGLSAGAGTSLAGQQTQSGSLDISGIVSGPPPPKAPSIVNPPSNAHFKTRPIQVNGDCLTGLLVAVTRNGVNGGSTICQADGTFVLTLDLFDGRNDLVATQYDNLNQASPPSATTTVFFDVFVPVTSPGGVVKLQLVPPNGGSGAPTIAPNQLQIIVDARYQGVNAGDEFTLPIAISGGVPPLAVSVDWGDGSSSLYSQPQLGTLYAKHKYLQAGNYTVGIKTTDAKGNTSFIQTVVVVGGASPAATTSTPPVGGRLLVAWPLYVALALLLLGFWLGERYDRGRWQRHPAN